MVIVGKHGNEVWVEDAGIYNGELNKGAGILTNEYGEQLQINEDASINVLNSEWHDSDGYGDYTLTLHDEQGSDIFYKTYDSGNVMELLPNGNNKVVGSKFIKGHYIEQIDGSLKVLNPKTQEFVTIKPDNTIEFDSTWTDSGEKGEFVISYEAGVFNTKFKDNDVVISSTNLIDNANSKIEDIGIYKDTCDEILEFKDGSLLLKDKEATASNLWLLLKSDKLSLFGDPYFGECRILLLY